MKPHEVVSLIQTENGLQDPLTELLKIGVGEVISSALEAEVQALLNQHGGLRIEDGRHAVVRNGYLPTRTLKTSLGEIQIKVPKVRDRSGSGISYTSRILPPYFKKTTENESSLAWQYLKGIVSGDFLGVLKALRGDQTLLALQSDTLSLLEENWQAGCNHRVTHDLSSKRYVGWWANCVHRDDWEDGDQSQLVIIGMTDQGETELVGIQRGYIKSTECWRMLIDNICERGLATAPTLVSGDSSLGIWPVLKEQYPSSRHQYCWGHKVGEVVNKLPDPMRPIAKKALSQIWMAQSLDQAQAIFDRTLKRLNYKCGKCSRCYEVAYCLSKDKNALFTFYEFSADLRAKFRRPSHYCKPLSSGDTECSDSPKIKKRPRWWLWPVSRSKRGEKAGSEIK